MTNVNGIIWTKTLAICAYFRLSLMLRLLMCNDFFRLIKAGVFAFDVCNNDSYVMSGMGLA